jgi:hypothetical protein
MMVVASFSAATKPTRQKERAARLQASCRRINPGFLGASWLYCPAFDMTDDRSSK